MQVTSHMGCVSRNVSTYYFYRDKGVTSHMGCVSRNYSTCKNIFSGYVTSHMGCVSRNARMLKGPPGVRPSHLTWDV